MWQYCERKKKKTNKGKYIFLLTVIAIAVGSYLFVSLNVNPVLRTVSEEKVRALTTVAINTSAQNVMTGTFNYTDIIEISRDSEGDVSLIQVNTTLINTIARKTVIDSQNMISDLGELGIKVPIGSLSGVTIFAGKGPDINIKVYPVGAITSEFESVFRAAGINQTIHTVKLILTSEAKVVIPGASQTITTKAEIPLCESIIVGKVPSVYLQSTSLANMLDLIP